MEAGNRIVPRPVERAAPPSAALRGLRVALVHDWLTGMRGGEKCLEVLCRAFPDAVLHTLIHRKGALSPAIERMEIRTSPLQRIPGIATRYRQLLPLMPAAAATWRTGDVDLVVSLSHCVAKAVRVPRGVPHVCYCFTPMRYAWQGRDAYLESWTDRPARRLAARVLLGGMRRWDRASSSGVTHFVAISDTVRERIRGCYGRDSRVIHPPVDTDFFTPDEGPQPPRAEAPYLVVSALVPYKKVEHAVQACTAAGKPLVVIGEGTERARLQPLAGPGVTFLGWQPDDAIRAHYRTCRALLFPGEEDFGIVPVEALACGAPVIALGRGGAAETIDARSGRLYDEPGPDGLRRAIEAWEADGMPHDPAHARRRAEEFALPLFRDRLLAFLGSVAGSRVARPVPPPPHLSL